MNNILNKFSVVIIPLILLFSYLVTINYNLQAIIYQLFLYYIFFSFGGLIYYAWTRNNKRHTTITEILTFMIAATATLWIGLTGWFISPFFYFCYILAIAFSFIFSLATTITFITVLLFLYIPNIGSIDLYSDIIMIITLIGIIPLSRYLQSEYLKIEQIQKKVLILEDEYDKFDPKVNEILSNKVSRLSAEIREPAVTIRQLALFAKSRKNKIKKEHSFVIIAELSKLIIETIEKFEKTATGRKLVHTHKKS